MRNEDRRVDGGRGKKRGSHRLRGKEIGKEQKEDVRHLCRVKYQIALRVQDRINPVPFSSKKDRVVEKGGITIPTLNPGVSSSSAPKLFFFLEDRV